MQKDVAIACYLIRVAGMRLKVIGFRVNSED